MRVILSLLLLLMMMMMLLLLMGAEEEAAVARRSAGNALTQPALLLHTFPRMHATMKSARVPQKQISSSCSNRCFIRRGKRFYPHITIQL